MAIYDDLIAGGLLSPSDQREAALMGLFNLGAQIGNRGAARLSPTPPPLDLAGPMAVYQNSMNAALQRGALAKKLRDEKAMRNMFAPQPVNEQMARGIANRAVASMMARPEMDDPGAFGSDYDAYEQGYMDKALPVARQQTTVPAALQPVPAAVRPFISAVAQYDPKSAITMAGNVLSKMYTPGKKPSMVQEYEYARANGYGGTFEDYVQFKGSSAAPKTYGQIPPGYRMVRDAQGRPMSLEVIPGGPAAAAEEAARRAATTGMVTQAQTARFVLDTADQILNIFEGTDMPVTGLASVPLGAFPSLPAGRIRTLVAQLKSPIALGALKRLKDSSATGASGFGALNTAELELLISDMGRLDPNTTAPDIFQANVRRIRSRYQRVIDDIKKEVSPEQIRKLNLGPLLGMTATSSAKKRKKWNPETQRLEEVDN